MTRELKRRGLLKASAAALTARLVSQDTWLYAREVAPQTFTYKTIRHCQIKADVYLPAATQRGTVAVWIHGGALIMGDRRGIDRSLLAAMLGDGYPVISIDYRLAPETKLPGILEDLRDAFAWVRARGEATLGRPAERIVVLGGSAGGYLTLVSGYLVRPRPAALVSFWGYGDIAGPWYSQPSAYYRRARLVSEADARAAVGTEEISTPPKGNQRSQFYLYCRQNGVWPKEVAGIDPDKDKNSLNRFCPLRNVSVDYPPTLLIHGTIDTDVPHEQSVLMDRELARQAVPHELISVPGAGHGLQGASRDVATDVQRRVLLFLRRHSN
jgi:acetyl esterase/lipase